MRHNALHPRGHHHFVDKLAVGNAIISGLALYPQIFVILAWGVQNNLSPMTLGLIVANNVIWLIYGVHRALISISIAAVLSGTAACVLLVI